MMKKKVILGSFVILGLIGVSHALNTVRVNMPEDVITTGPNSYPSQQIITLSGSSLIDQDNDEDIIGDFFSGKYYDSAHGVFSFDALNPSGVNITSSNIACVGNTSTHDGYRLAGYSWSFEFGAVDFDGVHICVPRVADSGLAYLEGYAYSELIGFQNFSGIEFDSSVDGSVEHNSEARYVKIEGLTSSQNYSEVDDEFQNEVRVLGNVTKSSLRKQVLQNVYKSIRNISPNNGIENVTSLGNNSWNTSGGGKVLQNGTVLYFGDSGGSIVQLGGNDNIEGNKTLLVEGGDIYIRGNIRNTDSDDAILGIIAVKKGDQGGNIYIDPAVTDIHANMYADESVLSYNGTILGGDADEELLRNQLYIYGSIFSENTIGGADSTPLLCPYYIDSCDLITAKTYDLNYLRRYILVSEVDADGDLTGNRYPASGARESYIGDNDNTDTETDKPGYRVYPVVIEYNASIQKNPPPFF